jgi:AcrR family transcriptional regulator
MPPPPATARNRPQPAATDETQHDTITVVGAEPGQRLSLRERKKRDTRARMIDAAIELVEKQGYTRTTVEQIAEAADVSPRTVAHYFPSKDQLLLSLVDLYAMAVTDELAETPADVAPMQALLSANLAVLDAAATRALPTMSSHLANLLRTLHVSPALQPLALGMRSEAMCVVLGERMNVDPRGRQVELVMAVWAAVISTAWAGVNDAWSSTPDPGVDTLIGLLRDRLSESFYELGSMTSELTT